MTGTLLKNFTQLMAAQSPAWASGPDEFINDAYKSTWFVSRLINGSDRSVMLQSGTSIRDRIFLEASRTYQRYSPNPTFTPTFSQTGREWSIEWSFATAWITWTKHELGLNKQVHSKRYRTTKFKSVLRQKHQNLRTEIMLGLDDEFIVNAPNYVDMESASPTGPRLPYTLHAIVNEYDDPANGSIYATTPTGEAPLVGGLQGAGLIPAEVDASNSDWISKQNIDTRGTGNANWRNYQNHYGAYQGTITDAAGVFAATALFTALSEAFWKTEIHQLPKYGNYSDKKTSPNFIVCSVAGIIYYEQLLRLSQDEFRGMGKASGQDPHYNGPTFRDVPFHVADGMSQAEVYISTSLGVGVTELDANVDYYGPRYIGVNGLYMTPYFHNENYFAMDEPMRSVAQPFTYVQYCDMWNNFGASSMRRHFHLRPNAPLAA